jgi:hypothetical protein
MTEKVHKVYIVVKDEQLKMNLRGYMPNNQKLFDKEPQIGSDELFTILPNLRQAFIGVRILKKFANQ